MFSSCPWWCQQLWWCRDDSEIKAWVRLLQLCELCGQHRASDFCPACGEQPLPAELLKFNLTMKPCLTYLSWHQASRWCKTPWSWNPNAGNNQKRCDGEIQGHITTPTHPSSSSVSHPSEFIWTIVVRDLIKKAFIFLYPYLKGLVGRWCSWRDKTPGRSYLKIFLAGNGLAGS